MLCPVCGTEVVVITNYADEHGLLEYEDSCPNKCYHSSFSYGLSNERIGNREWDWTYHETNTEAEKRRKERKAWISKIKKKSNAKKA